MVKAATTCYGQVKVLKGPETKICSWAPIGPPLSTTPPLNMAASVKRLSSNYHK